MRWLWVILCAVVAAPWVAIVARATTSCDLSLWAMHAVELGTVPRSLLLAAAAALMAAVLGAAVAYQVSLREFPLRRMVERLLVLPLLFPPFVLAAIYRRLSFSWRPVGVRLDLESSAGFIFVMSVALFPYVFLLSRAALQSHGRGCIEVGKSVGLPLWQCSTRLVLPVVAPAISVGALLVFVEASGEWATASFLSMPTTAVAIHQLWFARDMPHLAAQLALLFIAAVVMVYAPFARWGRGRRMESWGPPVAPPRPEQNGGRPAGWLRLGLCATPVFAGFVLPAAYVLFGFVQTVATIDLSSLWASTFASATLTLSVSLICLAMALAMVAAAGRGGRWVLRGLVLSYTAPAMVVAVGTLVFVNAVFPDAERYNDVTSFVVLAFAAATRYSVFLLVPLSIGMALGRRGIEDLGVAMGLSRTQSFLRLQLPMLRPFAVVGLLLVVVQALREVPLSVVLGPFSFRTLAIKTHAYIDIDLLPESSTWILAMALLSLYPILTIENLLRRSR
ncbi:MAG: hypothetical protein A2341_25585 [Deltaproteobacteria bacterium RIFOXYB12_FULL_58_9]|nr:MAG: hypothetical protein A2341_25585 [Deltaproteobacteria bacterium RIFOXYB12_FULL_58_9]